MAAKQNVILVGPMGAGKSTIGRQLASILGLVFVDSDQEIEARTGADIPWIFDVEGEEGFRNREEHVIDELTKREGIVLATGGGAVIRPRNRANVAARGFVVYLETSIDQQLNRTSRDRNRPLLQKGDPRNVLTNLMALRDPLYREVSDYVIATDGRGVREVAQEIANQVRAKPI